ncbi:MAG: thioredoxin [Thaumarchaeota archaeon]|nr:MAG: thioredoxin [Nitrososphaerota archaeon]
MSLVDEELEKIMKKKLSEMTTRYEPKILELNDSNFDKAIVGETPLIIDFWATWCGPCQFMLPIFTRLAKKYRTIRFARVNVDDAQGISQRYEVYAIPTFIVFKNGKPVDKAVGAVGEPGLHMLAQKYS